MDDGFYNSNQLFISQARKRALISGSSAATKYNCFARIHFLTILVYNQVLWKNSVSRPKTCWHFFAAS